MQDDAASKAGEIAKKFDDRAAYKWMHTIHLRKSASQPSKLYLWHFEETRKKEQRLENEIDINMIKAAVKGVKNEWFKIVEKNKDAFKKMIEYAKYDWKKILEFKDNYRE